MAASHYNSGSRGLVEIASMNAAHLANAHGKLVRERVDESRDEEIAAMAERLAQLDAEADDG